MNRLRPPFPRPGPLSLRARLTVVYSVGVALALIAVLLVVQHVLKVRLLATLDQELAQTTAATAAVLEDRPLTDSVAISELLNALTPEELATAPFLVVLRSPEGVPIVSSPPGYEPLLHNDPPGVRSYQVTGALGVRVRTERLPDGAIVQAAASLENVDGPLWQVRRVLALAGAVTLPLVALLAWLLAGRGLRPLADLSAFAGQVRAGNLSRRPDAGPQPREVQRLTDAFNVMLARLDESFTQQARFASDVSHELRTPLTALRGGIDVLLMQPRLPTDAREQLEEMSAECARLIRLTQNLLALARLEAAQIERAPIVDCDLACLNVVARARMLRTGVAVEVGNITPARVHADADLLGQMIFNLVDNAVRHVPPGGRVVVSMERAGARVRLTVSDTGPGIAEQDLPYVFDRFYRGTSERRSGGLGLGLALVRWIATRHGGDVTAANRPEGGAMFTVRLPVAAEIEPVNGHDRMPPAPAERGSRSRSISARGRM